MVALGFWAETQTAATKMERMEVENFMVVNTRSVAKIVEWREKVKGNVKEREDGGEPTRGRAFYIAMVE